MHNLCSAILTEARILRLRGLGSWRVIGYGLVMLLPLALIDSRRAGGARVWPCADKVALFGQHLIGDGSC